MAFSGKAFATLWSDCDASCSAGALAVTGCETAIEGVGSFTSGCAAKSDVNAPKNVEALAGTDGESGLVADVAGTSAGDVPASGDAEFSVAGGIAPLGKRIAMTDIAATRSDVCGCDLSEEFLFELFEGTPGPIGCGSVFASSAFCESCWAHMPAKLPELRAADPERERKLRKGPPFGPLALALVTAEFTDRSRLLQSPRMSACQGPGFRKQGLSSETAVLSSKSNTLPMWFRECRGARDRQALPARAESNHAADKLVATEKDHRAAAVPVGCIRAGRPGAGAREGSPGFRVPAGPAER